MPTLTLTELSNDQLMAKAPAIFATESSPLVSDRYTFVSTIKTLDSLRDYGFIPVDARMAKGQALTARHRVTLLHRDHLDENYAIHEIPRIIMENSHDRTARLSFTAGYYRMVCSNGLIIASGLHAQLKAIHLSLSGDNLDGLIRQLAGTLESSVQQAEVLKAKTLNPIEISTFACFAAEVRYRGWPQIPIAPKSLLQARRKEDEGNDMWRVFNRVQENIFKGGITSTKGRQTKGVNNFGAEVDINRRLWAGADALAVHGMRALKDMREALRKPAINIQTELVS